MSNQIEKDTEQSEIQSIIETEIKEISLTVSEIVKRDFPWLNLTRGDYTSIGRNAVSMYLLLFQTRPTTKTTLNNKGQLSGKTTCYTSSEVLIVHQAVIDYVISLALSARRFK